MTYRFAELVFPRLPARASFATPSVSPGQVGEAIAADYLPAPSYAVRS